MPVATPTATRQRAAIAVLAGVCAALLAACLWQWLARPRGSGAGGANALPADPDAREALLQRLIETSPGGLDSHPDADVSYVLRSGEKIGRTYEHDVDANPVGMRERAYALPKPTSTVRIALLGDSYVFGWGVAAGERLGVELEALLRERAPAFAGEIECLHLAVAGWNVAAECAFALRQLEALRPDLVIQFTAENDLNDNAGVRGFGEMANFAPAHRERADGRIHTGAAGAFGFARANLLACGLDYESRSRLEDAAAWISRLRSAVLEQGGEYLLVANWDVLNGVLAERWQALLPEQRFLFVPGSFVRDEELRLSRDDRHWSPAGHRAIARMLLGELLRERLLPALALRSDPDLEHEAALFFDAGRKDARIATPEERGKLVARLLREIDLQEIAPEEAVQVHGGLDGEGLVSPYASLLLRRGDATTLELAGESISELALRGARVEIFADELPLGVLELGSGPTLAFEAVLPPQALAREVLSIRLVSSDYVYAGLDLRRCVAFRLKRVALVP